MFLILGICIALASLFLLNALVSLLTTVLWQLVKRPARHSTAATRAAILFVLRLSPPAISLVCVIALLLPAYIELEPRETQEVVGFKLIFLAVVSIVGLGLAIWRGLAAWRATRRITADWLRHAEPASLPGVSAPTYLLHHRFPIIAVVGVLRPRLFIAGQVFDALNAQEIAAAIAHEHGHIRAHDNLKRALLRGCHDALTIVPDAQNPQAKMWVASQRAGRDDAVLVITTPEGVITHPDALARRIPNSRSGPAHADDKVDPVAGSRGPRLGAWLNVGAPPLLETWSRRSRKQVARWSARAQAR